MVSPSQSTSSVLGNHFVLPSFFTMPHISGALMSGTFGTLEAFFQAMGPRFGVPSREVGLLAFGVCKGVNMEAIGAAEATANIANIGCFLITVHLIQLAGCCIQQDFVAVILVV